MMKGIKKIFCLMVALCLGIPGIFSAPHNIVRLKDGSILKGDVIVQRPGKDVTINAEEATFKVAKGEVKNRKQAKIAYDKLSREWKRWALENNALEGDAYGRYLSLEDVQTDKYTHQKVKSIKPTQEENNSSSIHYVQMVPSIYKIKWEDVEEIKRIVDDKRNKVGLDDEITVMSGKKYTGKILSQHPGKDLTIRTKKGVETVKSSDILEMKKLAKKGTTSWKSQTDYSNIIVDKKGGTRKGLILTHHFGKNSKDNYVEILTENDLKEKIEMSEIEEYQTQYDQQKSTPYKDGEVYVNEFLIKPAKVKTFNGKKGFIDDKVYPFPEGIVTTFKTPGGKFQGTWTLIALEDVELDDGKRTKGYNDKIKENNAIKPSTTDMAEGISSLNFVYLSPGFYALTNGDETESYIIKIVK